MAKHRITLLAHQLDTASDTGVEFFDSHVVLPSRLCDKRQDRVTLDLNLLDQELHSLLDKFTEIRVQWAHTSSVPDLVFQNFNQHGLFVHLKPVSASTEETAAAFDSVGQFFSDHFGLLFNSSNFISTPSSATFYTLEDPSVSRISQFLKTLNITETVDDLKDFQLQYAETTKALKVQWISEPSKDPKAKISIHLQNGTRKEIAILKPGELNEFDLELSGIRTILDTTDYLPPTKTMFFVKPRHQLLPTSLEYHFGQPIGLHPELHMVNNDSWDLTYKDNCQLFTLTSLTNRLIFDKYQYNDKQFALLNLWGELDLEAPVYNVSKWGSQQLMEIIDHNATDLEITYHSRYDSPKENSKNSYELLLPDVFWACEGDKIVENFMLLGMSAFDDYGLGYDSFFEESVVYFHYRNDPGELAFTVPTAQIKDYRIVQIITSLIVILGVNYLFVKLFKSFKKTTAPTNKKKK